MWENVKEGDRNEGLTDDLSCWFCLAIVVSWISGSSWWREIKNTLKLNYCVLKKRGLFMVHCFNSR